jgi:hypothetical protein
VGREGVAAEHRGEVVGLRAHHGQPCLRSQWQHSVVREQHHGLLGQRAGERPVGAGVEVEPGIRQISRDGGPVGIEQAELRLLPEHPPGGAIHQRLVDRAVLEGGQQRGAEAAHGWKFHVHARREGQRRRLTGRAHDPVQGLQKRHSEVVGHHGAVETPAVAEHGGEQVGVRGGGYAVDLGVRVHHRTGAAVADRHLERQQVDVGELARADADGTEVAGPPGAGIAGEVLERGDHAGRLQAAHVRGAHGRHQVGVLADGLLGAPPAGIADHVQHRRETLVCPDLAHGRADRRAHPLDQVGVERGAPRQRRRVDGGPPGHESGEALLVRDRGNPEAAGLDDVALHPGEHTGALGRLHRRGAERSGDLAESGADRLVPVERPVGHVVLVRREVVAGGVRADPHAVELGDLLLEGHPAQQVFHPFVDRQRGVAPRLA